MKTIAEYKRRWYLANRDRVLAMRKANYRRNREAIKRRCNAYYHANKSKVLPKQRSYYQKHRRHYIEQALERNKKFPYKSYLYHAKVKYGITKEEYEAIFKSQRGRCAICRRPPKGKRLAIDHCHKTSKVRGLLCDRCNRGIGTFRDNYSLLELAIKYLEERQ